MTASDGALVRDGGIGQPCDGPWREATARAQERVLPQGRVAVACTAPLGVGGLGRHLREIIDALGRGERSVCCTCGSTRAEATGPASRPPRHALGFPYAKELFAALPLPVSAGRRTRAFMAEFDAYAAQNLPDAEHLIAFNGQALAQFGRARRAGFQSLALVSANPHLRRLAHQHTHARARYPLERSWAEHLLDRSLAEYAQADRVYFASDYIKESFLEEGFPEERLARFPLTPDARFAPDSRMGSDPGSCVEHEEPGSVHDVPLVAGVARETQERFEIVYVGSLTVHKGVPLLIEAVGRLSGLEIGLRLVGGWASRGMRRFIEAACARDGRITVSPGDPLPHLRRASLYVHPAYEDGFGYAPAEALACGVPVIVSEDTGMKELIDVPHAGLVLPTGDLDALTEAIEAVYRGETPSPPR